MLKRFIGLLTVLNTLALGAISNAGTVPGYFTQIDMQDGGYLPAMIQHWSGRLYGRTDGGGAYRSDNMGNSWTFLGSNFTSGAGLVVQGLAVQQSATSSSNVLLQAVGYGNGASDPGRGVWKTTDGGATWTQTLSGVNFSGGDQERTGGECIIFHPTNDSEAWVGSRGQGLYKSTDAGSTWTQVANATFATTIFSTLYFHPSYPDQMFVGGDGGLWGSVDHGATWTQINNSPLIQRVTRGADGTVYFGGISGSTQVIQKITSTNWTSVNWTNPASFTISNLYSAYISGIGNVPNAIECLTVLRDGRLIAGDFDDFTRISTNQGGSFTTLPAALVSGPVIPQWSNSNTVWRSTSLIQDVNLPNTWYGGGGYGPFRTDDGGQTWQYICTGIGEVVTFKIAFHPSDSNRLYIPCMDLGGAVVTDGGVSGNTSSMLHTFFPSDIVQFSQRALVSSNNGVNRVLFPGGSESSTKARIYATTNDGSTWYSPASVGLPTGTSGTQIVEAMDSLDNPDDYLVVCGGTPGTNLGGIYRTTDGGATFTQCNWYLNNTDNIGASSYRFVYLARDPVNLNVRYLFGHVTYPATPPANSGGGFFVSVDRGVNWTQLPVINGAVIPGDTTDWWGKMSADSGVSGSIWITLQPSAPGRIGLAHSTNGGTNFFAVPGFTNVFDVDARNGNVVVYGERLYDAWNKIYYSTNNGTNWDEITRTNYAFGNTIDVALDPFRPGRILISTGERSVGIFWPTNLTVAPSITRQPVSQTIGAGTNATLSVTAAGSSPFFYQWRFNGSNASTAGPTLTLPRFAASNAGRYDVVVTNHYGSVTSSVAILTLGYPPAVSIPTGIQTALIGDDVILGVTPTGTSPFFYQWQFNGVSLPSIITTVAGSGEPGESGDGGLATNAMLYAGDVATDGAGNFFIADSVNDRVRKVNASGVISTVAGNGTSGFSGDGGAATNAQLFNPVAVAVDGSGNLYIADEANDCVRRVAANGIITTVAGNGIIGVQGDGGPATNASFSSPVAVAADAWGNLYIADQGNNRIREVGTNGIINTIAGSDFYGFSGDGGPAIFAGLWSPSALAVDAYGNLFIADSGNLRIRKVAANGIISTVAGSGYAGYYGDGGLATSAFMESPVSVAVDGLGDLFIADGTQHIRKVGVNKIISTRDGQRRFGFFGRRRPGHQCQVERGLWAGRGPCRRPVHRRHG